MGTHTHDHPPAWGSRGTTTTTDDDARRMSETRARTIHQSRPRTVWVGVGVGARSRRRLDDRAIRPVRHTRTRDVVHRDLVLLLHRQAERARGAQVAPRASCDARREDDGARERRRCVESTRSVELVRGTYDDVREDR